MVCFFVFCFCMILLSRSSHSLTLTIRITGPNDLKEGFVSKGEFDSKDPIS